MYYTYKVKDRFSTEFIAPLFFSVGDIFDWVANYTILNKSFKVEVVAIDHQRRVVKCEKIKN